MRCLTCKDERVIWTKDKWGSPTAVPCPQCNKNGKTVREEMNLLEREAEGE
ncbi:hypothetical protein KV134_08860 [Tetragenococcus halophilus]|uniref:hypothetical protein n=1 Tax=Tetragenococcus halophilus TaxID=51669 RepID=UPI001C762A2A|nr:hypothetical protein KV134_08860 [Tetragenococcus halophilus]